MKKKLIVVVVAMVCVIALLASCTAAPAASSAAAPASSAAAASAAAPAAAASSGTVLDAKDGKGVIPDVATGTGVKIAVTYQDLANEYIKTMSTGFQAEAKRLGVTLMEADGAGKAENQISQTENFITTGAKAVILSPYDKDGSAPVVDKCVAANIPCVLVNSLVSNADKCITFVGSDSVESGRIEMRAVAEKLNGKGNIVIIEGPAGHSAQIDRLAGIKDVLTKYPDIKIAGIQNADWDRAKAMTVMENFLQSVPQIDAVVAENDEMAMGAVKALQAAGKLNKPTIVIGIDAIADALNAVKTGDMIGTVFQDAIGQGTGAVDAAVMAATGKTLAKSYMIPYVLVNKDNLAQFQK